MEISKERPGASLTDAPRDNLKEKKDAILILDFGGQYCHLIARRIREWHVYSEIRNPDITALDVKNLQKEMNIRGIILSGGPQSVYGKGSPTIDRSILRLNIPILGLCYGHQLIAHLDGGDIRPASKREFGDTRVFIDKPSPLLSGFGKVTKVWMSHGDSVYRLPKEYEAIAHSNNTPIAAFRHRRYPIYGLQWHPEVAQTENGELVIRNFITNICRAKQNWKMGGFIEGAIKEVRRIVENEKCIVALSGGIDSAVAAALVGRAIGRNLTAVYVDTGFMRQNETEEIRNAFSNLGFELVVVDASDRFFKALEGVADPEQKRKIIGREFAAIFESLAKKVGASFLVQGTIYPDRVESGMAGMAAKIKTHHNVGGLPKGVKFKSVIEPLKELYKDEVREIAMKLGLPGDVVHRQPFPGPGLAVRIIGEVTIEKANALRKADAIVREEMERSGNATKLWQYFAVLTGTKSVGVKGDSREYGNTVALRVVISSDAMTARFAELPWQLIRRISTRITNEVPGITRVVYDITDKPPSTIEWE